MSVFRSIAKLNNRTTHVEVSAAGSLDAGSTPAVSIHKPFSLMVKGFLFYSHIMGLAQKGFVGFLILRIKF